jgi:hypothetical protein
MGKASAARCLEKVCSWALALPTRLRWSQFSLVSLVPRQSLGTQSGGSASFQRKTRLKASKLINLTA